MGVINDFFDEDINNLDDALEELNSILHEHPLRERQAQSLLFVTRFLQEHKSRIARLYEGEE